MKFLILATPRSGSSQMHTAVTTAHKMSGLSEPFNHELQRNWDGNRDNAHLYPHQREPFAVPDNFVIKALAYFNHWPDVFYKHWEKGFDHYLNVYYSDAYQAKRTAFFQDYVRVFDRTFLLLRRDVGSQLRSMLIGHQRDKSKGERTTSHWWGGYEAFDPILDKDGALNARLLFESIKLIETIGRDQNIPILYYEDLFADQAKFLETNAKHDLGLENMWADHFDPSKKWAK